MLIGYVEAVKLCGIAKSTFSNGVKRGEYPNSVSGIAGSSTNPQQWNRGAVIEARKAYVKMKAERKANRKMTTGELTYQREKANTAPKAYTLAFNLLNQLAVK